MSRRLPRRCPQPSGNDRQLPHLRVIQIRGSIVNGQWMYQRAGGNPGVGANWDIYPDTGWVGVILSNSDGAPLPDMIGQEMQAITGAPAGGGSGG